MPKSKNYAHVESIVKRAWASREELGAKSNTSMPTSARETVPATEKSASSAVPSSASVSNFGIFSAHLFLIFNNIYVCSRFQCQDDVLILMPDDIGEGRTRNRGKKCIIFVLSTMIASVLRFAANKCLKYICDVL